MAIDASTYNDYKTKLKLIQTMKTDRRTNKQIMAAMAKIYPTLNISTEDKFLEWLRKAQKDVQEYLKTQATTLKSRNPGMTNAEIGTQLGYSETYIALLLNGTQQGYLDNASVGDSDKTKKQKARNKANNDINVTTIASDLGVSADTVKNTYLGADFMKGWAKRLADNDTSVASIATKLNVTEAIVQTYLGDAYLKRWAKRLAKTDTTVKSIATLIGKTESNVLSYLGTDEMKAWAKRLADKDTTVSDMATKFSVSTTTVQNTYLGTNELTEWAKRLADNDKSMSTIASTLGYSSNTSYIINTLLGTNYQNLYNKKHITGGYMAEWVWRLKDGGKQPSAIATQTGLTLAVVNSYIKTRTDEQAAIDKAKSDIAKAKTDMEKQHGTSTTNSALHSRIMVLVRQGTRIETIQNDTIVKQKNNNTKPTLANIRSQLSDEDKNLWARALAAVDTGINGIMDDIYGERNDTNKAKVQAAIGESELKEWAKRLADNITDTLMDGGAIGNNTKISYIATKLGYSEALIQSTYLGEDYMKKWVKKLSRVTNQTIAKINTITGLGTDKSRPYLDDNTTKTNTTLAKWIKRMMKDKKKMADILSALDYANDPTNRATIRSYITVDDYKKWAQDFLSKDDTKFNYNTIPDIDTYIGLDDKAKTLAYLGGVSGLKSWISYMFYNPDQISKSKPMSAILTTLGLANTLENKQAIVQQITINRFRYFARKLALYGTDWTKDGTTRRTVADILTHLGVILYLDNKVWKYANVGSTTNATNTKYLLQFIDKPFVALWVQRIDKNISDHSNQYIRETYFNDVESSVAFTDTQYYIRLRDRYDASIYENY